MDKIQHSFVHVRDNLKLHVAETGTGPVVVFLHGFPEIWYSWRHQMIAVAEAGFRAIAPDSRGYGLSDQPQEPEKTTFKDLVDDLHQILDKLSIPKILLVGKDSGARWAYQYVLAHPDRVTAIVTLGVPFLIPGPESFRADLPKGFYFLRWQEPGRAEKDFERFDIKTVVRKIYIMFSGSELPTAEENQEIMDLVDRTTPLPPWFTEQDLQVYAESYEKSGFRTALQIPYRGWMEEIGVDDPRVETPALLIMGKADYALKIGFDDYIRSGSVKKYVPNLETVFVPEGSHFVQEQFPDKVNQLLISFFNKHME